MFDCIFTPAVGSKYGDTICKILCFFCRSCCWW